MCGEENLIEDIAEINASFKAVMVDFNLNFGGYDRAALVIANRFAAAPTLAYSECPADAQNPMTLQRRVLLYVLTSDMTVSAGEILNMALRALPQNTCVDHCGIVWEGRGITPDLPLLVVAPSDPIASHCRTVETNLALIR